MLLVVVGRGTIALFWKTFGYIDVVYMYLGLSKQNESICGAGPLKAIARVASCKD